MEIYLDKRAVRQILISAADAIEDGDHETLREDLIELFSDDEVEELERRTDAGDVYSFIAEILEEWDGEDPDEIFELLEGQLSDADIEFKYASLKDDDDDEDDDEGLDEDDGDDLD